MKRFWLSIFAAAVVAGCLWGCASVPAKGKASATHQSVHAAIAAIDDFERSVCQPDKARPTVCTNPAKLITDAQHQAFSKALVAVYRADINVAQAIIDWKPGAPRPDFGQLRAMAQLVFDTVSGFTESPSVARFIQYAKDLIAAVDFIIATFPKTGHWPASYPRPSWPRLLEAA